jgi:hypothetical protein
LMAARSASGPYQFFHLQDSQMRPVGLNLQKKAGI